jgi:putative zinc finger/helix-turn-helix YgiT family protein
MSMTFCPMCMKDVEVRVEERREVLPVRGEEIEVLARVAVCQTCNEDVWSNELDDETLAQAFAEYRRRHRLLHPGEMTRIRKEWGVGQRAFSLLLGWGEITLHRYESGSLQDAAHDAQLRMAEQADNVRILLDANGDRLTRRQREAIERRLREAEDRETDVACEDEDLERLLAREAVGAFGGDAPLSLTKIREMIVFFSETPNMFVTKLAKLMFYTDFLHYKEYTTSITGLAYAHLPRGPVPERYERLRDDVVENGLVRIEDRLGKTWAGEVLVAERAPRLDVFSADELQVLECVRAQLGALSSKAVSDLSHSETAYTSTAMGDHISYRAARELSLAVSGTDD